MLAYEFSGLLLDRLNATPISVRLWPDARQESEKRTRGRRSDPIGIMPEIAGRCVVREGCSLRDCRGIVLRLD